jgi:ubiquinone biosynthesis protein
MWRHLGLIFQLIRIARILARHDALALVRELHIAPFLSWAITRLSRRDRPGRPGQKLAAALVELGPSFIKLGQFLSTRADLLGEQIAADLSELQDRLPPFPTALARRQIESELGGEMADWFARFDDAPVSAASIAQVHFAVTNDGEEVAIKILRPGVERAFRRDLALFYALAEIAESQSRLRRFKPRDVVQLFESVIELEMDLRMEAAAISELSDNFAEDEGYRVPQVDWRRSARRVLTLSRVEGIPLDDRDALIAAGFDLSVILTRAAEIFFKQVFRDGFFHGDQHPGNMSVDRDGNIVAVDFGIMGRLDRRTRAFLADMLLATLARDYRRLAEVHLEAGFVPPDLDLAVFAQALRSVCEPIFGRPLNEISFARLLAQLLQLTESFSMPVQPQLLLLQKNMLMAEGISRRLDPSLNIWTLAQPLIEDWMREHRGPEARARGAVEDLWRGLERFPPLLANLERAAAEIAAGGVRLHPESIRRLNVRQRDRALSRWALAIALGGVLLAIAALV